MKRSTFIIAIIAFALVSCNSGDSSHDHRDGHNHDHGTEAHEHADGPDHHGHDGADEHHHNTQEEFTVGADSAEATEHTHEHDHEKNHSHHTH